MSLFDKRRAQQRFDVDEQVKKVLARWSKERHTPHGLDNLEKGMRKLTGEQRVMLIDRLAEISLGVFFVIEKGEAE